LRPGQPSSRDRYALSQAQQGWLSSPWAFRVADQPDDCLRAGALEERHGLPETMSDPKPIRVLVIDDSAYNRQTISSILEGSPGIQVIGRAGDGEEGLKLAFQIQPDVITLDLEMPKMDGFSFLRLLMARQPTPVIVISGYATRENVFKA